MKKLFKKCLIVLLAISPLILLFAINNGTVTNIKIYAVVIQLVGYAMIRVCNLNSVWLFSISFSNIYKLLSCC